MKKNVAILCGGDSSEYEVSLISGQQVYENIDTQKFNPYLVLAHNKRWTITSGEYAGIEIDKNYFGFQNPQGETIKFDVCFVAIHGTPGEDGKLQGYFDMMQIPYTTCNLFTLALTFNKFACKLHLQSCIPNFKTAKAVYIHKNNIPTPESIIETVGLPCFIKPNNGGSSCGVSKVKTISELQPALEKALKEDSELIIEQFIEGLELTCGIIKTSTQEIILPLTEVLPQNEFFDYEAKYFGKSLEITPARVSPEIEIRCKDISKQIANALNCKGIVRIDYILKDDEFYFLEINTVPGLTKASFIPQQVRAANLSISDIYSMLIEDCITTI